MINVPEKIAVSIRYYLLFYIAAGNLQEEQFDIIMGSTLRELLEELSKKYGEEFSRRLWDEKRELLPTAWILRNGKRLDKEQLDLILGKEEKLIITTPMLVGG